MSVLTYGSSTLFSAAVTALTALALLLVQPSSADEVHLNYTGQYSGNQLTPDRLTVSILNGSQGLGEVHLKRSPFNFNVPVYTLRVGPDGRLTCIQENLSDVQNVGFYQDVATEAVIQITTTSGQGEAKPRLVLKGELNLGGQKYSIGPEQRKKRDVSASSPSPPSPPGSSSSSLASMFGSSASSSQPPSDEVYELNPEETSTTFRKDGLRPAPEIKISLTELSPNTPILVELAEPTETSSSFGESGVPPVSQSSSSSFSARKSTAGRDRRRKRRQAGVYYIDVVAVIDYGAYSRFLNSASSRSEALQAIREYYAFVFNGMDLRYQNVPNINYQIRVRLTKVIVSETSTASTFTENFRVTGTPWDSLNAMSALEAFEEFAVGTGAEFLNPYDHGMLFTGYDLSSSTPSGSVLTTTGLAYTGTLCRMDGKSVSVVEDLGGFQSIDTATHELGHSLSAKHDGEENLCRSTDRYIMAGGTYTQTAENALHPWEFSTCSANYFSTFISDELRNSRGRTCLTFPLSISASIPDVSDRLPGQEFPPDEQCKQIYGPESRLCRGREFGEDICTAMFCFDPATVGTCYEQTAARGTTCGNGKICLGGQCLADPRAPTLDEDCLFGDQPGAAFSGQTCEAFISGFTGYCYQELVRGRCCSSCKAIYRQVTDCEYGDKVVGCSSRSCPFATTSQLEQCCGTCNYGTPFTTTGTTKPATQTTVTTATTTTTPAPPMTTAAPPTTGGCQDNPDILVNQLPCDVAIGSNPSLCYQDNVLDVCCASCRSAHSGVQGCEYGDRYPTGCSTVTSCVGLEQACCDTCSGGGEPPTTTTIPTTTADPTFPCVDNPMIRVNQATCRVAVGNNPSLCNVGDVINNCCASCAQAGYGRDTTTTSATTEPTTPERTTVTQAPVCRDNPLILVNGLPCQTAVQGNPSLCYTPNVAQSCCFSCSQAHTGTNGCEFGDRFPDACQNIADCTGNVLECCATCASGNNNNNNNNNSNNQGGNSSADKKRLDWSLILFIATSTSFLLRNSQML